MCKQFLFRRGEKVLRIKDKTIWEIEETYKFCVKLTRINNNNNIVTRIWSKRKFHEDFIIIKLNDFGSLIYE